MMVRCRVRRTIRYGRAYLIWPNAPELFPNLDPVDKISTHLLELKTCMKFIVKCCHNRDVDGQIFVLRTVNKHPHAWCFLILEQSLGLKGGSDITLCYLPASTSAQFHALLAILKYLYQGNLVLLLSVGLVTFHLAIGCWGVERFDFVSPTPLFSGSHLAVLKKIISSNGSLDQSSGICCLTKGFWLSLNFPLDGYMWSFV
jgi:hypothetical protein